MEDRHDRVFYRSVRMRVPQGRPTDDTAPMATEPLWVFADQLGPHDLDAVLEQEADRETF